MTRKQAMAELLVLSAEIAAENGQREERLSAKCNWEQITRTAVLIDWPDIAGKDKDRARRAGDVMLRTESTR